jgi:hypothetical protein
MLKKSMIIIAFSTIQMMNSSCEKQIDIEAEEAAIKAVIENETKAAYARNYDEFIKTWAWEPYCLWTIAGKKEHYELAGWDTMATTWKKWMAEYPESFTDEVIRENYNIRVYGKGAWVTFEQHNKQSRKNDPNFIPVRAMRVLEKTDQGWKVVLMCGIHRDTYRMATSEE